MASRWPSQNSNLSSLTLTLYLRPCIEKLYLKEQFIHLLGGPIATPMWFPKFSQGFLQKLDRKAFSFSFSHLTLYPLFCSFICSFIFHCIFSFIFPLFFIVFFPLPFRERSLSWETSQHCHLCLVISQRSMQRIKPNTGDSSQSDAAAPMGPHKAGLS